MKTSKSLISSRYGFSSQPEIFLTESQLAARDNYQKLVEAGKYKEVYRPCQICRSEDFGVLAEKDRYGLPIKTMICKECGFVQTNPVLRASDYDDFYAHHYRNFYGGMTGRPNDTFFSIQYTRGKRIFDTSIKHLSLSKEATVADVGCGAGGILYRFHEFGCKTVGVDFDDRYLSLGRDFGLDLRQGGLEEAIKAKPTLIIYSHVLEHVYDLRAELEKIYECLPEGGAVVCEVPGLINTKPYNGNLLKSFQGAHLYYFTKDTLDALFHTAGFTPVYSDELVIGAYVKTRETPKKNLTQENCEHTIAALLKIEKDFQKTPSFIRKLKRLKFASHFIKHTINAKLMKTKKTTIRPPKG